MRAPTIGRNASMAKSERPRQRRWDVIGAPSSSSEGTGVHSKGGGGTPVLMLRLAVSEVGTSAERHILHTFSHSKSGTLTVT